jgi:phage gp37-like protein
MPQVSSRTCCAAAVFVKIGGARRGVKQPKVEIENLTYADFYWVTVIVGRRASDVIGAKTAVVHRTSNPAQLCVRTDLAISNCLDRHNFATDHSAFSPMPPRTNTERQRQGSASLPGITNGHRLPKS